MKWERKTINELCEIKGGKRLPKNHELIEVETNHPYIRARDIGNGIIDFSKPVYLQENTFNFISRYTVKADDIVLTIVGANIGDVGLIPKHLDGANLTENAVKLTSFNENCHFKYLLYYFLLPGKKKQLEQVSAGSAQGKLGLYKIKDIEVPIPPLPTQRKIASILSAYDDLIENNLKRIKLLEEKAFLSYKLIVKSEKLIEGKVGDLADVKSGYAFKSREWSDEGFPVIKIKNIGNNDIELSDCSFIPENIAEAANKFKLNAGDLLIAMTGATVGKIGMMPKTETSFYLNQRVGIFKPKVENAELFLFCFFNEPTAKNAVQSLASGAAQPNISGGQLESIKLFYPKLEVVAEFGNSIKSHFQMIWNLKEQNTRLREARDILLPKLMNGQIEV
jgi:type I restriction enzyme S subunit